jgi:hypothetical protein
MPWSNDNDQACLFCLIIADEENIFLTLAIIVIPKNLFSSLMMGPNKLERFTLESLSNLVL